MDAMGIVLNVRFSTEAGVSLDQIYMYTALGSEFEVTTCHQGLLLSDHHVVHWCSYMYIPRSEPTQRPVGSRSYRGLDCQAITADFSPSAIDLDNIDSAVQVICWYRLPLRHQFRNCSNNPRNCTIKLIQYVLLVTNRGRIV